MKRSVSAFVKPAFTVVFSLLSINVIAQISHLSNGRTVPHQVQVSGDDIGSSQSGAQVSRDAQITLPSSVLKVDKKTHQHPTACNAGQGVALDPVFAESPPEVINALYKGAGLYRGFDPADELAERRTRGTKHFRNQDGTVTAIVGAGDLHYQENGQWKEILSHILPNNSEHYTQYQYAVIHNAHKLYFPRNPGEPIVAKIGNEVYRDWEQPGMVWLDAEANVLSELLMNGSSVGIVNKDSIRYEEIFPQVDAVIKNSVTSKKLSYFLKDLSIIANKPAEAVFLAFRETISTNSGWKMVGNDSEPGLFSSEPEGQTVQDILFEDAFGGAILEIGQPIYFEELPRNLEACSDPKLVDTTDTYSGNYLIKQTDSKYVLYTLVPVDWLSSPSRDFPVVIDPITNFYPGGTWPTYTAYRSNNSGTWACAAGIYAGRDNYYDISYGWVDDTWPTSNPFLDGYATFDISALQNNDCVSAVTYYWYHYEERNCGTDVSLKFGEVQFNANLAEEPDCNVTGIRVRNNNNYYNGTGKNSNGWKSQAGNVTDFGLAMPGNQITLGWAYNCEGGDCNGDCCSTLCSGDDGNYHHVYGYEHSTAKPYASVTYTVASNAAAAAIVSVNPTCPGQSTTLTVSGGSLGTGATWEWYSGSCGGTSVGSGVSIAVSPATTTTYYVRAEGSCNTTGCVSVTVNVTNTTSTAAASASASISPTCPSQSTSLTVSGGTLGTGANWNWYSGSCGGTSVGTGSPLAVAPTVTTTYYVRAEGTCNTTACVSVTVTVNTNSVAATSASASVNPTCPSQATTLSVTGGTLGTGATWNWYSGSCGGTFEGAGTTLGVSPVTTTTYYVRAEGTCNTTTCASVTVIVNTNSTAATGASASVDPICDGSSTTLSVTGGALGTGANWTWYSGSCGGSLEGTGVSLSVSPSSTTTYYVRAEGVCNTTACVSVTVTVNSLSVSPTSASASVNPSCEGQPTTLSFTGGSLGTGGTWNWYSVSCGGTLEGTGTSISVSPTTTTTYYVRAEGTCNTTACISVTVVVNTNSVAATGATTSVDPICDGNSTTLSVTGGTLGTGADWNWYTGSCGGVLEGTGSAIAVSPSTTTTYYVRAEGVCNTTTCVSVTVTVDAVPTADAGSGGSTCGLAFTFGASPSIGTGTWTQVGVPPSVAVYSPNANSPTATVTVTAYGTYFFRWTEVNASCSDFDDIQVDFYEQPAANAGTGDTVCGTLDHTLGAFASVGTGTWTIESGPGTATYVPDANTANATTTVSIVGTYTFEWREVNGVCDDSATVVVLFANLPTVSYSGLGATYCISDTNPVPLTPTPVGGAFSGNGVVGNDFFPDLAAVGTNVITYTYTDVNGCTNSALDSTVIIGLPIVSFSGLNGPYCGDDVVPVQLTGFPTGGVFSGPGVSGSSFTPATAGNGLHLITYAYTDGNGCFNSDNQSVIVSALPLVTFSGLDSAYCLDAVADSLVGVPSGGVFTGPGIAGNSFDPAVAGVGTHSINYAYSDGNGCSNDSTKLVTVNALPVVTFTGLNATYCIDDAAAVLVGSPLGGTFSGTGVSGGTFVPSVADTGSHTVTYVYIDGNGCTGSQVQGTVVTPLPVVSFSGLSAAYCVSAATETLTGSPIGGTFSGPGISSNVFDPGAAGAGTHSIVYVYSDGGGCTDSMLQSVVVNPLPAVTFSGLDSSYCVDASSANLVGFIPGGTFTGTGITGSSFDPGVAGIGNHAITYTYTDGNGCTDSAQSNTVVNALPVVTFTGLDTAYCVSAGGEVLSGTPAGGFFSGNGISGNSFFPSIADTGMHVISYTFSDSNSCASFQTDTTNVVSQPIASFTGLNATYCVDAGTATLTGVPAGGVFSGPGMNGSTFDPAVAGVGAHVVQYLFVDAYGCGDSTSQTVVVLALPAVTFSGLGAEYCVDGLAANLVGFPLGGTFSGTGVSGSTFDPAVAGVGAHSVTYSYIDGNGCAMDTTLTTLVNPLPVPVIVANGPTSFCQGDSVGLSAGTWVTYLWSTVEITSTITVTSTGAYIVQVTDTNLCSAVSAPISITVNSNPVLVTSAVNANCTGGADGTTTVVASGGTGPYSYLWNDGSSQTNSTATGLLSGTYAVTVTDFNGCVGIDSASVMEPTTPLVASIATVDVSCNGDSDGFAIGAGSGGTTPYTFQWDDIALQTTDTAQALTAGTYSVVITDVNGCTSIDTAIVSEPAALTSIGSSTAVSCNGGQDGSAAISAQGGVPPYDYLWDGGQIDPVIISLSVGNYSVTVTDDNGCQLVDMITVAEPAILALSVSETAVTCGGVSNGTATVVAAGGNPAYTYLWDDGQTTSVAVGLSGGLVSVAVVDSKGCNAAIGTSITENLAVTSTTTAQNASIGNSDGSGSVTAVGGVAPYTYVWSSGQTSSAATGLSEGIYIIGIEDNAGCTVTDTVIIEVAMIDAATAFTPNGDGVNDFWTIGDMSLYPKVEVTIMGRWGQMIFSSIGYEDPWDGTYQGKELPMGSYFFIIDLHEGSDPVTGAVTIMK